MQQIKNEPQSEESEEYTLSGPKSYTLDNGVGLSIFRHKDVWPPFSAQYLLNMLLTRPDIFHFENAEVLDIGAGSGILGIAAVKLGASHVYMVDNNPAAITLVNDINLRANNLSRFQAEAILSDIFSNLPKGVKFKIIIGNLPMNPDLKNVVVKRKDEQSNQTKRGGRYVLEEVIRHANEYLEDGGYIALTTSSRQNFAQTRLDLTAKFDNWFVLNSDKDGEEGVEEALSDSYHGPFVYHWIGQSMLDGQFRIYQKDVNGNKAMLVDMYENGKIYFMGYIKDPAKNGEYTLVEAIKNGDVIYREIHPDGSKEVMTDLVDPNLIPEVENPDVWYHRYYIVVAQKKSSATTVES